MPVKDESYYSNLIRQANENVLLKKKKDYVKGCINTIMLLDLYLEQNVESVLKTRYAQKCMKLYHPTEVKERSPATLPMHIENYFSENDPCNVTALREYFQYCVKTFTDACDYALENDKMFELFDCVSKHEGCCLEMPFNEVATWHTLEKTAFDENPKSKIRV